MIGSILSHIRSNLHDFALKICHQLFACSERAYRWHDADIHLHAKHSLNERVAAVLTPNEPLWRPPLPNFSRQHSIFIIWNVIKQKAFIVGWADCVKWNANCEILSWFNGESLIVAQSWRQLRYELQDIFDLKSESAPPIVKTLNVNLRWSWRKAVIIQKAFLSAANLDFLKNILKFTLEMPFLWFIDCEKFFKQINIERSKFRILGET